MMKITNLKQLMDERLSLLWNAEIQLHAYLNKIIHEAYSQELQTISKELLKNSIHNKETLMHSLKVHPEIGENIVIKSLIQEAEIITEKSIHAEVVDAGFICAVQNIKHYQISGYGATYSFAQSLNIARAIELLHDILSKEKEIDKRLSKLANEIINKKALAPASI